MASHGSLIIVRNSFSMNLSISYKEHVFFTLKVLPASNKYAYQIW